MPEEKTYTVSSDGNMDWLTLDEAREEMIQIAKVLDALVPGQSVTIRRLPQPAEKE